MQSVSGTVLDEGGNSNRPNNLHRLPGERLSVSDYQSPALLRLRVKFWRSVRHQMFDSELPAAVLWCQALHLQNCFNASFSSLCLLEDKKCFPLEAEKGGGIQREAELSLMPLILEKQKFENSFVEGEAATPSKGHRRQSAVSFEIKKVKSAGWEHEGFYKEPAVGVRVCLCVFLREGGCLIHVFAFGSRV